MPGFRAGALSRGRHDGPPGGGDGGCEGLALVQWYQLRVVVGGRWDETGMLLVVERSGVDGDETACSCAEQVRVARKDEDARHATSLIQGLVKCGSWMWRVRDRTCCIGYGASCDLGECSSLFK